MTTTTKEELEAVARKSLRVAEVSGGAKLHEWAYEIVERVDDYFRDGYFGENYDADDQVAEIADLSVPILTSDLTEILADSNDLVFWNPETVVLKNDGELTLSNQLSIIYYEVAAIIANTAYHELRDNYYSEDEN